MAPSVTKRAVGVFPDRPAIASALQALKDSGFSMHEVSIIARDAEKEDAIAGVDVRDQVTNHAGEGATAGVVAGGILGGVAGLLAGIGALTIPGLGPILLAGEATALIATLVGSAAGAVAGGLVGALIGLGIPEDRAKVYSDRVSRGEYLVMLRGTEREIQRAEATLSRQGIREWGVYDLHNSSPQTNQANTPIVSQPLPDSYIPPSIMLEDPRPVQVPQAKANFVKNNMNQPNNTDPRQSNLTSAGGIDPNRGNDYNMVDHPMDTQVNPPTSGMLYEKRAVGVFPDQQVMENALNALRSSGFPMHKITIVLRDRDQHDETMETNLSMPSNRVTNPYASSSSRADGGLSGVTGLLAGLNNVAVPGMGSLQVVGAEATTLTSALTGRTVGSTAGSLIGALAGLEIPEGQAKLYSDRIAHGSGLVIVKGVGEEVLRATTTLSEQGIQDWNIYDVDSTNLNTGTHDRQTGVVGRGLR